MVDIGLFCFGRQLLHHLGGAAQDHGVIGHYGAAGDQRACAYDAVIAEEAAYQNMVAELKAKYQGKKLSILGDSISTYAAISNSTKYNSTIGGNAIWYPKNNTNFYDYTYTTRFYALPYSCKARTSSPSIIHRI